MSPLPDSLLAHPRIFRLDAAAATSTPVLSTGYQELDACLPGAGWPCNALNEILVSEFGVGELQLVAPALRQLCEQQHGSDEPYWLTWISPPHTPYAPALVSAGLDLARVLMVRTRRSRDALWAAEQAMRSGTCRAVLLWSDQADARHLRRLQLAAEEGQCWGVIFRLHCESKQASPAALRLRLVSDEKATHFDLLKVRGGRPACVTRAHLC
ncbi:MAG: translesion DNA synthesis-associated protein ImuA [Gammaproteobacteria bacterium]|nr:translesion DNA synthesis-associated protein ImuA [Gammaproteobacteria bacterium]